jgi:outer membrane receptor protein involved in Fe transport
MMRADVCKKVMIFHFTVMVFAGAVAHSQQTGIVSGCVIDAETGEPIIGANVVVKNTTRGAATDLGGCFVIPSLSPGEYELVISSVSYARKRITGVRVTSGSRVEINVALAPEAIVAEEVIVEARASASYQGGLLALQRKAPTIGDGISAEQIKRSPDATSADALRRIPGISIVENKFVFVRGIAERYSRAVLNGAPLPGGEPEKRSFAFDLIPTNLIDHATILKSFTPEVPGDVSGGYVQINTIDFPSDLTGSAQFSATAVGKTTFNPYHSYHGGSLDYLGIDDGTRKLPAGFPGNLSDPGLSPEALHTAARSLKNIWAPRTKRAPLNRNFSISLGDGARLFGTALGFVAALSYRTGFESSRMMINEYEASNELRFSYNGRQSSQTTLWGGLFNLSYKFSNRNKISLKNTFSMTAQDQVSILEGFQFTDAGAEQRLTALKFVSRSVYSGQLSGEHSFETYPATQLQWRLSYSRASYSEPDYRRVTYARPLGSQEPFSAVLGFQANLKNGGRFYSVLLDHALGGGLDVEFPLGEGKIKTGFQAEYLQRGFSSRLIGIITNARGNGYTDQYLYQLPLERIFAPENFRPNGFSLDEYSNGTNNYSADAFTGAAYAVANIPLTPLDRDLRFIGGVRLERVAQLVHSFDLSGRKPIEIGVSRVDLLPSVNLVYGLDRWTNVRAAYAQTVNRPELRELAPFTYFDFSTQTSVRGNASLQPSSVQNFDLRFEHYPSTAEILSAGVFLKQFKNAIEKVIIAGSALGSERTFANAARATNYGFEVESRLSFRYLSASLSDFSLGLNYTRVASSVDVPATETTQGRRGRPIQGQSPYVLNIGLSYAPPDRRPSMQILYNAIGARIIEAATAYEEDLIEEARGVVDAVIAMAVSNNLQLKMSCRDILARDRVLRQGGRLARKDSKNPSVSLGLSYEF